MTPSPEIARLWALIDADPMGAEHAGLLRAPELRPSGYPQTPEACLPFAWTGGDGVHFSQAPGGAVIMTVPMCPDTPNLALGDNLREFLALGLPEGFFMLEALAYDRDNGLARIAARNGPPEGFMASLAKSFALTPWPDLAARLSALHSAHAAHLRPA